MKKPLVLFALAICLSFFSFGQDTKADNGNKIIIKPSRDFVMLNLTYDGWANVPDDVQVGGIGRGISLSLCYDFPIAKSHFSFAAGLGLNSNNIYFKDQVAIMNTAADAIRFQNVDTIDGDNYYKRSKLNTTYLEAPFELRFFANKENRNRGFKAALGMHVGLLVGAHTKVKHATPGMSEVIVEKVNTRRYIQTWRFAPSLRVGWGNFSVYGSYNISQLFNAGAGPEVFPYSIGICISGL
jgi:hypothetical protein